MSRRMKMMMSYSGHEHSNNDVFSHHSSPGDGGDQRGIEPCSSVSKTHPKGRRGWNKETFFSEHKPAKNVKFYMHPQIC